MADPAAVLFQGGGECLAARCFKLKIQPPLYEKLAQAGISVRCFSDQVLEYIQARVRVYCQRHERVQVAAVKVREGYIFTVGGPRTEEFLHAWFPVDLEEHLYEYLLGELSERTGRAPGPLRSMFSLRAVTNEFFDS